MVGLLNTWDPRIANPAGSYRHATGKNVKIIKIKNICLCDASEKEH